MKTTLRDLLIVFVLVVLIVWAFNRANVHAQGNYNRLQVHAFLRFEPSSDECEQYFTACDTGNGAMIYAHHVGYREGTSLVVVPGGCAKVEGER